MKLFILAITVALAAADVSHILQKSNNDERNAKIVKQELDVGPESYQWAYETENDIKASETGNLKRIDQETVAQSVQGEASWPAPNGEQVSFQYLADENGYQPQGSHLPTPPPIPDYVVRALKYIQDHPPKVEQKNLKPPSLF